MTVEFCEGADGGRCRGRGRPALWDAGTLGGGGARQRLTTEVRPEPPNNLQFTQGARHA